MNEEYENTLNGEGNGSSERAIETKGVNQLKLKRPYTKYLLCELMASLLPAPYTNIPHLIPDSKEPEVLPGVPIRPKDCHLDSSKLELFGIRIERTPLKEGLIQVFTEAGIL